MGEAITCWCFFNDIPPSEFTEGVGIGEVGLLDELVFGNGRFVRGGKQAHDPA